MLNPRLSLLRRPRYWGWAPAVALSIFLGACTIISDHPAAGLPSQRPEPATPSTSGTVGATSKPNIVMVMADDMRVDDLRFAPTVRRVIGEQGLTFDNAFSPYPLCCPARASFLTGVYAHNHGVFWHKQPYGFGAFDDSSTIATALQQAGYRTGFVGKYLNRYGKDASLVTGEPSWQYEPNGWTDWIGALDDPPVKGIRGSTYNYFHTPFNVNGRLDDSHNGEYQTNVIGDYTTNLVRKYQRTDAPFFIYASFVAPHFGIPREPDDPLPIKIADGTRTKFKSPARPDWVKGRFNHLINRPSGMPKAGGPSEADMSDKPSMDAAHPELNAAEVASLTVLTRQRAEAIYVLDQEVKRLIATLKKTGEWSNTVLMFTSDNGYFLGEHRHRTGKVKAHEPSLRVPFLITGPGLRRGEHTADPITTVDLTATILDIAGAQPPHAPDGISRLSTMRTADQGWTVPVVTEASHTAVADVPTAGFTPDDARTSSGLRVPRYSFTIYRNGEGELYDLLNDPAQMDNQYTNPGYREVRDDLTDLWWQYKDCAGASCRAPMPEKYQATVDHNQHLTGHYWTVINSIYGW